MSSDQARSILERLADGELTPNEAEERLRALDAGDPEDEPTVVLEQPQAPAKRVRARLSGAGLIEVVGDDEADRVHLDGPHNCAITETADLVEVAGDVGDDSALVLPPDVDLEAELSGGNAVIRNVRGTVQARVNAGALLWEDAALRSGQSSIHANVGEVNVVLAQDADVRVSVRCVAAINADPRLQKVGRGVWQLGEGNAELEINGSLGAINLSIAR